MKQTNTLSNRPDPFAEFKAELAENIREKIAELRADKVVRMSMANLMQVTRTPRRARGPVGTNAAFVYAIMFREAAATLPAGPRRFIYAD